MEIILKSCEAKSQLLTHDHCSCQEVCMAAHELLADHAHDASRHWTETTLELPCMLGGAVWNIWKHGSILDEHACRVALGLSGLAAAAGLKPPFRRKAGSWTETGTAAEDCLPPGNRLVCPASSRMRSAEYSPAAVSL